MRRSTNLAAAAVIAAIATILMTGCTAKELPSYDTVRGETEAAMRLIVDQLPAGAAVKDLTVATPYGCDGGGAFFTGHWFVTPPAGFDTKQFIESLPQTLAGHFIEEKQPVAQDFPSVSLRTTNGSAVSVDISDIDPKSNPGINILAISRCAQPPSRL